MTTASRWALMRPSSLLLIVVAFLGATATLTAQARVEGRVSDAQGRPVPNATVLVVGRTTTTASAQTDDGGRFTIDSLATGEYDFTASVPGLLGEARGIAITDRPATVDISMRVSAVSETLVVSASQIDQPLSRTADSVTVISGQELDARQITSLGDALLSVPGFVVARSGGPGTLTSLFPRGGESDFTLVLVDGIRANSFGGGLDLSQVPLADIDRIEVVRGPQSAIYGADAIGGVVQVITRTGGPPTASARIEGGSRSTRRFMASTTGGVNAWRWQGGGDYFQDDGFTGIAPASGETVSNDDVRERQAWVGGGWRATRGTDVQGIFRYVDTDRGAPGPYGSDPADRFRGVNRISRGTTERNAFGLRVMHPWNGPSSRIRQRVELDVADYDLFFVSQFGESESDTRRVHGRVQTDGVVNAALGLSGGIEFVSERGRSTFITAAGSEVPIDRRVLGTFGEARWAANDRLSVQAGLRAEYITRKALDSEPSGFPPRPTFEDDTVVSINPKVSVSWLLSPSGPGQGADAWTRVHAAGGTGIRPPDAFEIAFTDNPELKPERSKSLEVGVTQALAGGAVQLDATGFFNQYDDLIVSVGSLLDVSRYATDNISNARARGLETSAAWRASIGIGLKGTYTFLDTEIRAVDGQAQAPSPYRVGDRLLRRPTHQGSLALEWTSSNITVFASLNARGETLDAEPAFGPSGGLYENPGRALVDLGGGYTLVKGVEVFARVLNLFDRDYEEVLGYPSPGRTAFTGVRIAARR